MSPKEEQTSSTLGILELSSEGVVGVAGTECLLLPLLRPVFLDEP